jgi:Tol biopolymer transport system component
MESRPGTAHDILVWHKNDGRVSAFLDSKFSETFPEFSPDGRWIAYTCNDSKRDEVYVKPFPGPGGAKKVSQEGGTDPLWARNGKQLFYRWQNQRWAVEVQNGSTLRLGKPRLLFERQDYTLAAPIRTWDISLDNQRFLMVKLDERKPRHVREMILVQNWFEELKRLVPAGRN